MNKLWFPVKPRRFERSRFTTFIALGLVALALPHCGYQPAYGGERPTGRLTVVPAPSRAPESAALAAVLGGLRGELSRAGVLTPGTAYPRVVVELVRVDERGTGQLQMVPGVVSGDVLARGTLIGVTARAWVEEKPNHASRDTGDVRRTTDYSNTYSTSAELASRQAALEASGMAAGAALGRRLLGEVEPSQEPM